MDNASIGTDVKTDVDSSQIAGTSIVPAIILATSTVGPAVDTRVESTATGVGNNLAIDLVTISPDDAFLFANNIQQANVDIVATSTVAGVTATNFSGLGLMDEPLVSSQAAAIGNNFAVRVEGLNTLPQP